MLQQICNDSFAAPAQHALHGTHYRTGARP
jgi:hypothetical protein